MFLAELIAGVATDWNTEGTWFEYREGQCVFLFTKSFRQALNRSHPAFWYVAAGFAPRTKRPGREADRLPASSAEVKNEWSCTFTFFVACTTTALPSWEIKETYAV